MANLSGEYVLCESGTASSVTGTASETNLATCAIPAAIMGANSCFKVWSIWGMTNNGDTKTLSWRFNSASGITGTQYFNQAETTEATVQDLRLVCNSNSLSAQVGFGSPAAGVFVTTGSPITSAINMANAAYVNFTGTLGTTTDTITLLAYIVWLDQTAGN